MGTSGKQKWSKYFAGNESVDTTAKAKMGANVPIYSSTLDVLGYLDDGDPIAVTQPLEYSAKFLISCANTMTGYVSQASVAKPKKLTGATENLGVRAETLITGGHVANVSFEENGTIRCRVFTSANDVIDSIITGLSNNRRVSNAIVDTFTEMRESQDFHTVPWKPEVTLSERNELGKYVGELLIGAHALSGHLGLDVAQFAIPESSTFAGVDSFLIVTSDNSNIV